MFLTPANAPLLGSLVITLFVNLGCAAQSNTTPTASRPTASLVAVGPVAVVRILTPKKFNPVKLGYRSVGEKTRKGALVGGGAGGLATLFAICPVVIGYSSDGIRDCAEIVAGSAVVGAAVGAIGGAIGTLAAGGTEDPSWAPNLNRELRNQGFVSSKMLKQALIGADSAGILLLDPSSIQQQTAGSHLSLTIDALTLERKARSRAQLHLEVTVRFSDPATGSISSRRTEGYQSKTYSMSKWHIDSQALLKSEVQRLLQEAAAQIVSQVTTG